MLLVLNTTLGRESVIASTFGFYVDLQNGKQTRRQEKPACIPYCIGRTYA